MSRPTTKPADLPMPPLANTYWVIKDKFMAGEYPRHLDETASLAKLQILVESGASVFVDLTHPDEGLKPYHALFEQVTSKPIQYYSFPIPDAGVPESPRQTKEILDTLDRALNDGQGVYLHCRGGVGRTGTIIGCWLTRHGREGEQALEKLRAYWANCTKSKQRAIPETDEQQDYILNWAAEGK